MCLLDEAGLWVRFGMDSQWTGWRNETSSRGTSRYAEREEEKREGEEGGDGGIAREKKRREIKRARLEKSRRDGTVRALSATVDGAVHVQIRAPMGATATSDSAGKLDEAQDGLVGYVP